MYISPELKVRPVHSACALDVQWLVFHFFRLHTGVIVASLVGFQHITLSNLYYLIILSEEPGLLFLLLNAVADVEYVVFINI